MKPLSILTISLLIPCIAFCQENSKAKLSGRILGADSKKPIFGASVALVMAKDSSATSYAGITNEQGRYQITGLKAGAYKLFVSYIGYCRLLSGQILEVGQDSLAVADLFLTKNALELALVEIMESRSPVSLKKDTIEFNAGFYKTMEVSPLSELLKKLPGVEITADGTIMINGSPVKQILIDGKPYFGNDLKMAASNILAGMISKVQLIDRKTPSEDRGTILNQTYEKAINITLKKDYYNQLTGLVTAGYGSNRRYASRTTLNRFKAHQQISIIASADNTGNFHEGMNTVGGNGNTTSWNAGINLNQDLSPKLTLLSSYMASGYNTTTLNNSVRQTFLKDSSLFQRKNAISNSSATFHAAEISLTYFIDSSSNISVINRLSLNTKSDLQENDFATHAGDMKIVNKGVSSNVISSRSLTYLTNWTYTKNFSRPGQSLVAGFNYSDGYAPQKIMNLSHTIFTQTTGEQILDSLNQLNRQMDASLIFQVTANYAQPLYKDHFLDLAYVYSRLGNTTDKSVYVPEGLKTSYDVLVDSLSAHFKSLTLAHYGSLSFRTQKQKYDYAIGLGIIENTLTNKNLIQSTFLKKRLLNFFPTATFNYTLSKTFRLHFDYSRNVMPPAADQLQPVLDNSNQLYLRFGNPDLKPITQDYFNFSLRSFNPAQRLSYSFNSSVGMFQDQIVYNLILDSLGRQRATPVNISGGYSAAFFLSTSYWLKALKTSFNSSSSLNLSRDFSYTNAQLNQTQKSSLRQAFSFNYTHNDLFDVVSGIAAVYNKIYYTLQQERYNYFDYNLAFGGTLNLPLGIAIATKINYTLSTGRQQGYNNDMLILNGELSKSVFARQKAQIKLQVFDLLAKNLNRIRNIGENYIEDTGTNPLGRFVLLSFTFYLKKK